MMMTVEELRNSYGNALERVSYIDDGDDEVHYRIMDGMPKGLIYLSHPFGGLKDNMMEAGQIANRLQAELGTDGTILSPIHNFSWLAYREESNGYWEDIYHCLRLLSSCDGMILSGDWTKSLGCCIEYLYAIDHDIPVYISD